MCARSLNIGPDYNTEGVFGNKFRQHVDKHIFLFLLNQYIIGSLFPHGQKKQQAALTQGGFQVSNFLEESASNRWWLVLLQGVALLILGALLLTAPKLATLSLIVFLGIYWLVSGIFAIVEIFTGDKSSHWGWPLLYGALGILAGLAVLGHPLLATVLIASLLIILLGIVGLVMGIINLARAFKSSDWGIGILGVIDFFIGVLLLTSLSTITLALPFIIGILALTGGVLLIVLSFRYRKEKPAR